MEKQFTYFLPAEKASPEELRRQRDLVASAADLLAGLDATLGFALILNRQRQALFANKPFREFLAAHGGQEFLGQRPGNLAGCVHSEQAPGGCGTTEACLRCGRLMRIALDTALA